MKALSVIEKIEGAVTTVLKVITIALFVFLTLILTANVFVRFVPIMSLHWLDEIVEMSFAALVFYGAAAVWMAKGHFSAGNWIGKVVKNRRARVLYRLLVEIGSLLFVAILFRYSLDLTRRSLEVTAVFQIPKRILYACMPVSSAIMILYSVKNVILLGIEAIKPKAGENGRAVT